MVNRSTEKLKTLLPGLGLATLIAATAHLLSMGHVTLDPHVLSILISIIIGNLIGGRGRIEPGISFSRQFVIPIGIILYGTQLDLQPLRISGIDRVYLVIAMVVVGVISIFLLSKALGIRRNTGLLLAAGSSICGASAIIVLAPILRAEKEDMSISLLTITVIGLTGVILYPLIQDGLSLSDDLYALLCGSTLPQMGQVQAAASLMGDMALNMAVPVKLIRLGMLLPAAVAFSVMSRKQHGNRLPIPWFIMGFLLTAAAVNLSDAAASYRAEIAPAVKFFFSIAIASIGLSIDLESIIEAGPRPLLTGLLGWIILVILFTLGATLIR